MPSPEQPSGRQVELQSGDTRVIVVQVGGGLRQLSRGSWEVLDGYSADEMADSARGQPLLPWPNRLDGGRYTFRGEDLQLPMDEVERQNAIHGLTRWADWAILDATVDRARLALTLHPRPGYPFALALQIEYVLDPNGLTVRTTAQNVGSRALPFGAGQHPYFSVGTPLIDAAMLEVVASSRLELDSERRLPTGRVIANDGTELDFCKPRSIDGLVIDACFSDLARDPQGRCRVKMIDPGSDRGIEVWADAEYRYVQVFSGDTVVPARRRQGLAIEPMTCPPNAFRTGTDVRVLEPQQTLRLEWGVIFSAAV